MSWKTFQRNSIFVLLFTLACLTGSAFGQTGTSSVRGIVTDPHGAVVPNAEVTISNAEFGFTQTTTTDADGVYQFQELRPGTYTLTVKAAGFATVRQSGVVLLVAVRTTNDVRLEIASGITTVEVTGVAQTINTQDATLGNAFNQTQISALPFEGRDPAGILSLQPGVVTVADRGQVDTTGDSRGGSVNGGRSDQTNLTLDGVDNNDQTAGNAFTGALRATLDSIEEFRVTTTNSDADQGRSSGAQVQLVTKSGTNQFHGSGYWYNRPTNTVANDYFNKHAELSAGEPNQPPHLLRNTYGGTFGGPLWKDRVFFFLAYEGQQLRENSQQLRTVPSDLLREGIIQYQCATSTECPGGSMQVQGIDTSSASSIASLVPKTYTVNVDPGYMALGAPQIASMDLHCAGLGTCPWGPGVNPNVLATMNQYPSPNTDQTGDGFNFRGYTFSSPAPQKLNTYIARFDYNLTQSGTQRLFLRLGMQGDHADGAEWFPGQPAQTVNTNTSKGIIAGYTWSISPMKINNFHYGYIRQAYNANGVSTDAFVRLRGLSTPVANTRTTATNVPTHNFTDDFTWIHGKHTLTFGGNYRLITANTASNANSFSDGLTNTGFLSPTGIANVGGTFDPAAQANGCAPADCPWSFPAVNADFGNSYDYPMMALSGVITELDTVYVQDKSGTYQTPGAFVQRHYRDNELEFYVQDSWHMRPSLTMNFGLRYSLLQPPYETNGNQACPDFSLHDFFQKRMQLMMQGESYNPRFNMALCGKANGKPGFWGWDYKNLAPRISMAWSPGFRDGLLNALFGGPGKSSIRWGAGVYFDHFGQGVVQTYNNNGSFGFISDITFPPGYVSLDSGPRYTGLHDLPPSLIYPAPPSGFPVTPPDALAIYWGLDNKMKTPYSYGFDMSFSRDLRNGFALEVAYVGRLGRRLLQEKDLTQPLNLTDPKSGLSYFQAVTALAKVYRDPAFGGQGITTANFNPSMLDPKVAQYWTDMMQPLQPGGAYSLGNCGGGSTTSPVVAAFDLFCGGSLNETLPLFNWDGFGIPDANLSDVLYFPKNGQYSFYQPQDASLFAWTSSGRSNYNALQVMLRRRASHGLTFDFNYTFSKSIDMGSDAERVSLFQGSFFGTGEIYNPFSPGLFRAVSDFDATHQINANFVYQLPFGRGQQYGANWNPFIDAIAGGWQISGLGRWTSGFPFSVQNGFQFPTNWELNGTANLFGPKPTTGAYSDSGGDMNMFKDPQAALNQFNYPYPGEVGLRNNLRGQGYFGIDMSLTKTWKIKERANLMFNWSVYNISNSVRFDAFSALPAIDSAASFGKYSQALTRPRVMEFALRLSF